MKLRCLGDFVELRQGLAINKGSVHLVSDIQDITYCYPLLRIADMMDSNFSKFVSKDVNSSVIANLQDIIYTRTGQIGLAFRGMQGVVHNNSFIVSLKTDELEKDYLYTVLNSNFVKKQANSQAKNSVQPDLTHTMFKSIVIPVPDSREEQNRISKIINNINQKIQTNIQINQELEAMAKTLYDYWFVQFDYPDQNGNPYKSSGGKMVYHPELKREIPESWGVEKLGELIQLERGVTYSKSDIVDKTTKDAIGVLRATNIAGNVMDLNDLVYLTKDKINNKQIIKQYETLIVMSSGSKEHLGKNAINYYEEVVGFGAFCSKIIPQKYSTYINYFLQSSEFKCYLLKQSMGTNINNLTNSDILNCRIILPSEEVLDKFENMVEKNVRLISNNYIQNHELTQFRDWLLPMLMNGQVKII